MSSVYPDQGNGSTPTTYGFDPQFTVTQQAQPPPYPVPPYNTQLGPKPAWDYPPPPQYGAGSSYPMSNVPYPQPQPMQQQQQQVVIIGGATRTPVRYTAVESYGGQIVMSCLVIWFCNFLFGFIAFVLAAVANSIAVSDSKQARRLGRASYILSGTGILVTILTIAIVVGVLVGGTASAVASASSGGTGSGSSTCYYYQNGVCYTYRSYSYSYSSCYYASYYTSYYYNYIDGYCYYNY